MHGRVLLLDGVERAERNVLPVLNNLLENREATLDDGRHLIAPHRYDQLLNVRPHFRCVCVRACVCACVRARIQGITLFFIIAI